MTEAPTAEDPTPDDPGLAALFDQERTLVAERRRLASAEPGRGPQPPDLPRDRKSVV